MCQISINCNITYRVRIHLRLKFSDGIEIFKLIIDLMMKVLYI